MAATAINFTRASAILDQHSMDYRVSDTPGCIDCLLKFSDGADQWDTVPLTIESLREWLGY